MHRRQTILRQVLLGAACALGGLFWVGPASADVVTLTNGTTFSGLVTENSPTTVTIKIDGIAWSFHRERVVSVQLEAAGREYEERRERERPRAAATQTAPARSVSTSHGDFGAKRAPEGRVIVYGTSWCGFCARARSYFASRGIPYEDRDVEKDPDAREEVSQKCASVGQPFNGSVPVLDVYGSIIHGFDVRLIEQAIQQHAS